MARSMGCSDTRNLRTTLRRTDSPTNLPLVFIPAHLQDLKLTRLWRWRGGIPERPARRCYEALSKRTSESDTFSPCGAYTRYERSLTAAGGSRTSTNPTNAEITRRVFPYNAHVRKPNITISTVIVSTAWSRSIRRE